MHRATGPIARLAWAERYGPVLLLLALTLLSGALARPRLGAALSAVLALVLWLSVCSAARLSRRMRRSGLVAGALIVAVASVGAWLDDGGVRSAGDLLVAVAVAALAVIIARSLAREGVVTLSTISGLLCLYLLIGLFFAQLYMGIADVRDDAFTTSLAGLERFDLMYFSFVALTTVGFGDITPAIDLTKALAITEAVLGQIFLVTVVAAAVARVGPRRDRP